MFYPHIEDGIESFLSLYFQIQLDYILIMTLNDSKWL